MGETLKHNLISGINLYDDGINFTTDEKGLFFASPDGGRVSARREGRKWILRVCNTVVSVLVSESYNLWHECLGHPNEQLLRQMVSEHSCIRLPERLGAARPCEICADAKSTKMSSLGSTLRMYNQPLQMVVADLCGPFQEKALGGACYFLQIRDVFSTYVKIYTIVNKYEVTELVKRFIAEAERLTGKKVISWQNDGGGVNF